jgi:hypothetical protein
MRIKIVGLISLIALCLVSCSNCFTTETKWSDQAGNSIVYDWGLGDATVLYKSGNGQELTLCNYAYADSNERMNLYVSPNSTKIALLYSQSTNASVFPLGCGLRVYSLANTSNELTILKQDLIADVQLSDSLTITDEAIEYTDTAGKTYSYTF